MTGPAPDSRELLRHSFFDVYRPSAGFVMRTALLPFDEPADLSAALETPTLLDDPNAPMERLEEAVEADLLRGRQRLTELLRRPEVLEAVYVASPDLLRGLEYRRENPHSKKGRRAEHALWRYAQRMASRATPFGLFSGCGAGLFGRRTRLRLAPRSSYRRHSRLDMSYLVALAQHLESEPALREGWIYRPNSSLYRSGERWRYAEARLDGRLRSFFLVAVDADDYLDLILHRAREGARRHELVDTLVGVLVAEDPELDSPEGRRECAQEAAEYVDSLIDTQVLVSDLMPPVTGPDPLGDLIHSLSKLPKGRAYALPLETAQKGLAALDRAGLGCAPECYEAVADALKGLPEVDSGPWLFQVDLYQPAEQRVLGTEVLNELGAAADALFRLSTPPPEDELIAFRSAFVERWGEGAEVPLLTALDGEIGVGFGDDPQAAEPQPLLKGLHFKGDSPEAQTPWGRRERHLLRRWQQAMEEGALEMELRAEDLERLAPRDDQARPLPDAFQAMTMIAAESESAVDEGRFNLYLGAVSGPSGARLLGRFCHGDDGIRELVRRHGREEAALDPDALYAEVVHLPEGRVGNILCRPPLRDWEIPFLGRSGIDEDRRLPLQDLTVSVIGERIVLRSRRHGKRVIPRLTSAHGYNYRGLAVYRFLCTLQAQGVGEFFSWNWGVLETARFLPRVRFGRTVFARARWRVERDELDRLAAARGARRLRVVRDWRLGRRIPRQVVLAESDQRLTVDLEDALALEVLLDMARSQKSVVLSELFPDAENLPTTGPEGRFVHELTVPFVRRKSTRRPTREEPAAVQGPADAEQPVVAPAYAPGSEWLYARLYAAPAMVDRLLIEVVAPLRRWAMDRGLVDRWFFLRYGDPEWHLRLRFHGSPEALAAELLPALQRGIEPFLAEGHLRRFSLDTYRPEVDRYGGPASLPIFERLFHLDSEAVLGLLQSLSGDSSRDLRWMAALRGVHDLLGDFDYDLADRRRAAEAMRSGFWKTFGHDGLGRELGRRLRPMRRRLDQLIEDPLIDEAPDVEAVPDLAAVMPWLGRRTEEQRPWVERLFELERRGELRRPVRELVPSLTHMNVNRLIRTAANQHELVIYDFLERLYASRLARRSVGAAKDARRIED